MQKIRKTLFFILYLCCIVAQGQGSADEVCDSARRLLSDYRFREASEALAALPSDGTAPRADSLRAQAALGERMLQTVADVSFIDCLSAPRDAIFRNIPLYTEGGHHVCTAELRDLGAALQGDVAYMNDIGDAIFASVPDANGVARISVVRKVGAGWSEPQPIDGLGDGFEEPRNPFVDADGTTLYFAAKGKESLGGYDIFVTRYDAETRRYLKPQNIGMPYNSPADELLYAASGELGMGYVLTARGLPADSMSLYIFKYDESAGFLDADSLGAEAVRERAALRDVAFTREGEAQKVVEEWNRSVASSHAVQSPSGMRLVLSDDCVTDDVEDLGSARARRIAAEWIKEKRLLDGYAAELDGLRHIYNKGMDDVARRIRELELLIPKSAGRVHEMEKSIRRLEQEHKRQKH